MASLSYRDVRSYAKVQDELRQLAVDEFRDSINDLMTPSEKMEAAYEVAAKFSFYGSELGAQFYDYCSEVAGLDVDPAEVRDADPRELADAMRYATEGVDDDKLVSALSAYIQARVNKSIRATGMAALNRDYERGTAGGMWCRVPTTSACAWCVMLASNGAFYVSEKSATTARDGEKYHDNCNCVAVFHADAESIRGYRKLAGYKDLYYDALDAYDGDKTGETPYPEELAERVARARAEHAEKFERGEVERRWSKTDETLLVMRYMGHLEH